MVDVFIVSDQKERGIHKGRRPESVATVVCFTVVEERHPPTHNLSFVTNIDVMQESNSNSKGDSAGDTGAGDIGAGDI